MIKVEFKGKQIGEISLEREASILSAAAKGEVALKLDSAAPKGEIAKFMANETRFGILKNIAPERAAELTKEAQSQVHLHYALYRHLAAPPGSNGAGAPPPAERKPTPATTP
jgi:pyruvate-ferredoxin/flavodoxin oxidoreductase